MTFAEQDERNSELSALRDEYDEQEEKRMDITREQERRNYAIGEQKAARPTPQEALAIAPALMEIRRIFDEALDARERERIRKAKEVA